MFFENEHLSFSILEVRYLNQKNVNMLNSGRNFSGLSYRLRADTVLKSAREEHRLGDNSVTFIPSGLDYSRVSRIDEMIVIRFDSISYGGNGIEAFKPSDPGTISALFHRILECWNEKKPGYKYRCSAIMYEILAECYVENYVSAPASSVIGRSVDYMLSSFTRHDLTVGEIAAKSFMSEVYFRRLFNLEYGTSPRKYIINLRIKHAAGLISTGYYSLSEVAAMSGYTDYKYFSAEFKRLMGICPSDYSRGYVHTPDAHGECRDNRK